MSTIADIFDTDSTIAAISTPPGIGGIAVIRISGSKAIETADRIWKGKSLRQCNSHTAHLGIVLDTDGQPLDQAVATVYKAPRSFTGQDTVEFAVHGSKYIQREILASLTKAGARLALPGEFTRRAFTSGRLQLTQAEAIADIIASDSRAAHRLAMTQLRGNFADTIGRLRDKLINLVSLLELELDFSEEDVTFADRTQLRENAIEILEHVNRLLSTFRTGNAIKNGIPVAIVGPTNAGKSSLLNALVDHDRAIVSDIHGTTRDTIEETAEIGDYLFRFIDTAGLRDTDDVVENLGIERTRRAIDNAHIILCLIDASNPQAGLDYACTVTQTLQPHQTPIIIFNKTDIAEPNNKEHISISAKTHHGIDKLRQKLTQIIDLQRRDDSTGAETADDIMVTNRRHADALQRAAQAIRAMIDALDAQISTDLVAQDARAVLDTLAELTGQITTTDILTTIFSRFCIGK